MAQRTCERCGEVLSDSEPTWKKLCYACWRKTNFQQGKNIRNAMDRLGENNIVHNQGRKW